jgi:benzoylformate decarboxylase
MARPVAKWVHEVRTGEEIPQVLRRAFQVASAVPQGPAVIIVPADVMDEPVSAPALPPSYTSRRVQPDAAVVDNVAAMIAGSTAPIVLVADGVALSGAVMEVSELARLIGAPIVQGYATEVCVSPDDPRDAGPIPFFDQSSVDRVFEHHDIVIAVGTEVLRLVFPRGAPLGFARSVVHIGVDAQELAKNQPSCTVLGDERETLRMLIGRLESNLTPLQRKRTAQRSTEVADKVMAARARAKDQDLDDWERSPMRPARVMSEIAALLPAATVIADESVSSLAAANRYLRRYPGRWFRARGGALGTGMTLPLGLKLAFPTSPVVALVGDGAAMYTITALWTAAHHRIPVTWVILDNGGYRVLEQNTRQYLGGLSSNRTFVGTEIADPSLDFVGLAESMGVAARRVERPAELADALRSAINGSVPALIQVRLEGSQ